MKRNVPRFSVGWQSSFKILSILIGYCQNCNLALSNVLEHFPALRHISAEQCESILGLQATNWVKEQFKSRPCLEGRLICEEQKVLVRNFRSPYLPALKRAICWPLGHDRTNGTWQEGLSFDLWPMGYAIGSGLWVVGWIRLYILTHLVWEEVL